MKQKLQLQKEALVRREANVKAYRSATTNIENLGAAGVGIPGLGGVISPDVLKTKLGIAEKEVEILKKKIGGTFG